MYYRIKITNVIENTTSVLMQAYKSLEFAAEQGWAVIVALATINDLDYENQGEHYLGFHKTGHPDAGMGVYAVELIDENNNPQEL